jgi:hypothetical protein
MIVGERGLVVPSRADDELRHVRHAEERRLQVIGHHHGARARVGYDPTRLIRLEVDVHRYDHRAEAAGAVDGLEVLDGVRDHDRDPIAALRAEGGKRVCGTPGPIVELTVGADDIAETKRRMVGPDAGLRDDARSRAVL